MLSYIDLIVLFAAHFLGDFVFQWRELAERKSESWDICLIHGMIYALPFLYFGFVFFIITAVLHFVVDFGSSQLTKRFWKQEEDYKFWLTIGADQMVHMIILVTTLYYFGG